ncbi:MAG: ribonuclease HI, partial [Bifidobacterium sp.]|nr:ribonuclease HI [Bifidobacterium sp.]
DDDARASTATQPTTPTQPTVAPQPASGPQLVHSGLHVSGEVRVTPPPESSPYYDGTPKRVRGYIEVDVLVAGDGTARLDGAPFLVVRQ